jgi:hypothetical protein
VPRAMSAANRSKPEDLPSSQRASGASEVGWEAGILFTEAKKRHRYRHSSLKPRGINNLAFSPCFDGFRLFASVFVLCQPNDTRNDTRCERLSDLRRRNLQTALEYLPHPVGVRLRRRRHASYRRSRPARAHVLPARPAVTPVIPVNAMADATNATERLDEVQQVVGVRPFVPLWRLRRDRQAAQTAPSKNHTETVQRGQPRERAMCQVGNSSRRNRMIALMIRTGVAAVVDAAASRDPQELGTDRKTGHPLAPLMFSPEAYSGGDR